jgi:hypothetical protein
MFIIVRLILVESDAIVLPVHLATNTKYFWPFVNSERWSEKWWYDYSWMLRLSPTARLSAKHLFSKPIIAKEYDHLSVAYLEHELREFVYCALSQMDKREKPSPSSAPLPTRWLNNETLVRMIQRCFSKHMTLGRRTRTKKPSYLLPAKKEEKSNGFALTGLTRADLKQTGRDERRRRFAEVCGLEHPWLQEYCARVLSNMPEKRLLVILESDKLGDDVSLGMLTLCVPHAQAILNKWVTHLIPASGNITDLHKAAHAGWRDGSGVQLVEMYVASVGQAMLRAHEDRQTRYGTILLGASTRQYIYEMMEKHAPDAFALLPRGVQPAEKVPKRKRRHITGVRHSQRAAAAEASRKISKAVEQEELPDADDEEDKNARNEHGHLLLVARRPGPIPVVRPDTEVSAEQAKYVVQLSGYTQRADIAQVLDAYYRVEIDVRANWCSWYVLF